MSQADPALHFTPQYDQLMSENRIFGLKSALRLEWCGQDGHYETQQRDHDALTLGDSCCAYRKSNPRVLVMQPASFILILPFWIRSGATKLTLRPQEPTIIILQITSDG